MKRGFAGTPDGQLHYWEEGSGPPLVLLHLTPDPRSFLETMPYLGKNFRTIAIDTPGYGDSERPPAPYTEISQFADAFIAAADAIGLERFHLLGHMTGSNVAAEVAARHPERIDRLVLSELFDWASREEFQGAHARRFPAPEPRPDGSHLLEIWNQFSNMLGEVKIEDVQRRFYVLYQAIYKGPAEGGEIYGPGGWATAAPYTIEQHDLVECLGKIDAKTLILCAGIGLLRSGANPREDRDRLVAHLRDGSAVTADDISHLSPFTDPTRFAEIVTDFLLAG